LMTGPFTIALYAVIIEASSFIASNSFCSLSFIIAFQMSFCFEDTSTFKSIVFVIIFVLL
jgi:hypothetical protein